MSKNSRNEFFALREPPAGGKAVAKIVLNGLAREARNRFPRVGAYGNLSVIRRVYMIVYTMSGCDRLIRQFGWHRRSLKLLSHILG